MHRTTNNNPPQTHISRHPTPAITTNYPKPEALATKEYIEKKVAELEVKIAGLEGRIYRAMWLQGVAIIGINIATAAFLASLIK